LDKSNRHFSTKFLNGSTQGFIAVEKNAVFSTSLIIVELGFWVVATKAFSRCWFQSVWGASHPFHNNQKRIAFIVTRLRNRIDVMFKATKMRFKTPFTIFTVEMTHNTKQNALGPRFAT